ncbi:hypothetical protein HOC80_00920 [archaeon]|jgi:chromosomal replication initiation ATPase DnaA|nr:hypothetical protein [archaeon]MBT4416644.1 hypothetical protein [archaeon]
MNNNLWFRELGFFNNPFSIKPAAFHDKIIGNEDLVDELSYGVLNNKIMFLKASYGEGKTTVLKRLLNDFGGKKQVLYYSCNRMGKRLNIKKMLNGKYGFFGKMFDIKPKDMVLLLDEAQELGKKDYEKVYSYFENGHFKSIVFVGTDFDTKELPEKVRLAQQAHKVKSLTADEAVQFIRKRIGELPLLPDEVIREVFKLSNNNVRELLKNCEELCKYAVNYSEEKITDEVIKEVLGQEKPMKVAIKKKKVVIVKKKPVKAKKKVEVPEPESRKKVYNPDDVKYVGASTEDMLAKDTDEIFDDDKYF